METIHHHYVYGLMEEQVWRGWSNLYRHYLASPGLEYYWRLRHDLFSERFQKYIASLEPPAERRTVGNLLGEGNSRPLSEGLNSAGSVYSSLAIAIALSISSQPFRSQNPRPIG